jgi:hypothetical protein
VFGAFEMRHGFPAAVFPEPTSFRIKRRASFWHPGLTQAFEEQAAIPLPFKRTVEALVAGG